jgi:hypothetical protein
MKFVISILIIAVSSWIITWNTTPDTQLKNISKDNLYISINIPWQTADTNQLEEQFRKDKNIKTATVEIIRFEKKILHFITISAIRTSDDSIHFFTPPDEGGILTTGKLSEGEIESKAKSLNNKKVQWVTDQLLKLNNASYERLHKTDISSFNQIMGKYCYLKGPDSLAIVLAGP